MTRFCALVALFLLFRSSLAPREDQSLGARRHAFLPENTLWRADVAAASKGITKAQFDTILDTAGKHFDKVAEESGEHFVIVRKWDDPTVNAYSVRNAGVVEVSLFGGIARRPEISPEGFALILCHEISHAFGGEPYLDEPNRISAEGQADYQAARDCFRAVFPALGFRGFRATDPALDLIAALCAQHPGVEQNYCHAALVGGVSLGRLMSTLRGDSEPRYNTPDPTIVTETVLRYPKTSQCRLDSILAGFFDAPRPRCWFAGESFVE